MKTEDKIFKHKTKGKKLQGKTIGNMKFKQVLFEYGKAQQEWPKRMLVRNTIFLYYMTRTAET